MIKSTIREYYALTALMSSAKGIISAMYVTFLLHNNLNLFEVNLVNFVFFVTLFICEIPTGAFADVFGRKASFITACVFLALGMLIYSASDSFAGFAVAELISGVGMTFSSGAFTAWFRDKIAHHGYTGTYQPIFSRASQIHHASGIIAALLGSFIASVSMNAVFVIGAALFALTGIVASFLKEEYFISKKFSWKDGLVAMKETVRSSVKYGIRNKNVRFILIIVSVQIFAIQGPNMQWQPLFEKSVGGTSGLGFIWMGVSLSMMLGAWLAPFILRRFVDERKALAICQLLIGLMIVGSASSGIAPVALAFFFLHEVARGSFGPLKTAYLHDNIPSKERATIESFESLAHHGGGMLGLVVSGFLALKLGIPWTWGISGMILVVSALLLIKNGRK